ncbi:6,7-dimethyl-8-ribityllumazine synthase [Chlamydiales bacterium SCGC AB-751-O23]|jgi:6,7-dimethyl-8-ribityllumazine synthase|nr:6,7-dimethyl-8-ribityllumazine synthase [Chlamydiales bacterium SCGC AB-751-O23]
MMKIQATLNASQLKIAVIVAQCNERVSSKLLEGAIRTLRKHEALDENIDITYSPGNQEMPLLAKILAKSKRYDVVICLGALIKENQSDSNEMCLTCNQSIASASLETEVPIICGLLTSDNAQQAIELSGLHQGNKGIEAALNAIEIANLLKQIQEMEPDHSGFVNKNNEELMDKQAERV